MDGQLSRHHDQLRLRKTTRQKDQEQLQIHGQNLTAGERWVRTIAMKRNSQFKFQGHEFKSPKDIFGGSLLKGNPKKSRPLDSKLPIHLILRAEKGGMRLPKNFAKVNQTVLNMCNKHGVKLYKYANVGNHLHLLIKIRNRRAWAAFIRELTGRIAHVAQGLGGRLKGAEKFWKYRPYTRIVRGWQKAFRTAKKYVELNFLEAEGFIKRSETKTLRDLHAIWGGAW